MLRADWKQYIVLLTFAFLMHEVLTISTMAFVVLGLIAASFQFKLHRYFRNFLALGVFASYWITYGKIVDPEVGLNFLTSIIVLKILEKETIRDRYMIFFGLLLLISAGSLFEKTLSYVTFFGLSFLVLIRDFYSYLGQKWRVKDILLAMIWVIPLTFLLFFLVPRLLNPIPFGQNKTAPGEIGYTPDVNISQIESLAPNQGPVFQVMTDRPLNQMDLYWRGNTLSYNDGWNWVQMPQDREAPIDLLGVTPSPLEIKQNFRLYNRSDYFFTLDAPRVITFNREVLGLGKLRTLAQKRYQWIQRYEVIGGPDQKLEDQESLDRYVQVPLSKKEKSRIALTFSGVTVSEIEQSIRQYFLKEKFSYSLSPGRSLNLQEFMDKKIGFCSHYASAVALILRIKGVPTRLVSGYMGGSYNHFGDYYLISQNDAHVWLEALVEGQWKRLDPTEWIAPDRVRLGGDAFIESVQEGALRSASFLRMPRFLGNLKLWFGQWDFLFYQWLEEMDYHTQDAWLSRLKFKRQWLFSLIPALMVIFMGLYMWFLKKQSKKKEFHHHQELWDLFFNRIQKQGISLSKVSLSENEVLLKGLSGPKKASILAVWSDLVMVSFQDSDLSVKDLKKKIKKI